MSFQAGIVSFDGRRIAEPEASAVTGWVGSPDYAPPISRRAPGAFLAQASRRPGTTERCEAQPHAGVMSLATFDGRLDNRSDLLELLGGDLRADRSDAAIALAAFEKWDAEGLAQLIGDWSLAVWNAPNRFALLASDYAGVRPLYYSVLRDGVIWSTQLQPLVDWLEAGELDDVYAAGLLTVGGCPDRSPYSGIHVVPPGHFVKVTAGGTESRPFWKLPFGDTIHYQDESEYDDHLRSLFREAVRCRIPADSDYLCELSGGLDSSSVVCMASEMAAGETKAKLPTALSFAHEGSLDTRFYTAVTRHCGVDALHLSTDEYPFISEADAGAVVPGFWRSIHKRAAAIARQRGATAYLTGQLGDVVMGNWWDDSDQVAGLIRERRIGPALRQALEWSKILRIPVAWILGRALLSNLPPTQSTTRWCESNGWQDEGQEDSVAPAFRARAGLAEAGGFPANGWMEAPPEKRRHFRSLIQMLALRRLQAPEALAHLDYAHPFAHRPLVTFMMSIPAAVACGPGQPRRLMRRAFRQLWPPELQRRRSKDALGGVFQESLRPLAAKLFKPGSRIEVVERGYIERSSLQRRLDKLSVSMSCNEAQLGNIVLLELWLRGRETKGRGREPSARLA